MQVAYEPWVQRTASVAGPHSPRPAITSLTPPHQEREGRLPLPSSSGPFGGEKTLGHFHSLRFLVY